MSSKTIVIAPGTSVTIEAPSGTVSASAPDTNWLALDPGEKVRIIEAMGFSPSSSDHSPGCPAWTDEDGENNGYLCQCAGEPTAWNAPRDVQEARGETWERRVASREKTSVFVGSNPER